LTSNNPYFFYGHTARYALVGWSDRRIWLVLDDLNLAHLLCKIFECKITLFVFDLLTFKNYQPNLIDNSVGLNWTVPLSTMINNGIMSMLDTNFDSKVFVGTDTELQNNFVNDRLFFTDTLCQELQQQLMCIHQVISQIQLFNNNTTIDQIKHIVSVNNDLQKIEKELYNLANDSISKFPMESRFILSTINRLYE
jgi:hypothetical protein